MSPSIRLSNTLVTPRLPIFVVANVFSAGVELGMNQPPSSVNMDSNFKLWQCAQLLVSPELQDILYYQWTQTHTHILYVRIYSQQINMHCRTAIYVICFIGLFPKLPFGATIKSSQSSQSSWFLSLLARLEGNILKIMYGVGLLLPITCQTQPPKSFSSTVMMCTVANLL